jgi:ABC-type glycerol-3-phosphate transport system substrate-binding protein
LALLHPTFPIYEALNPAMAEVGAENAFMNAVMDVMKQGMTPDAALDKAFKRAETIFAKYQIQA